MYQPLVLHTLLFINCFSGTLCLGDETIRQFAVAADWYLLPTQSQIIGSGSASTRIRCFLRCKSNLECVQIHFETSTKTCKLLKEIPSKGAASQSGSSLQSFLSAPLVKTYSSVKTVAAGSVPPTISNGVILSSWTIKKVRSSTILRLEWFGSGGTNITTAYLSFLFNGQNCASPRVVRALLGHSNETNWPIAVEGICENLPAGPITVELVTQIYSYTVSIAKHFQNYILFEEFEAIQSGPLVQPNMYSGTGNPTTNATLVCETLFTKKGTNSALFLRYSMNTRSRNDHTCSRWYVTFDGVECATPGSIEGVIYHIGPAFNVHFPTVLGGICENIAAGQIKIQIRVGACPTLIIGDHSTNYWQHGHLSVEEIHLSQTVPFEQYSSFNVFYHHWQGQDLTKVGVINASVTTYTKFLPSSTLRVRYFGTLGSYGTGGVAGTYGSIWCFRVDNADCINPGKMCFDHWTRTSLVYAHKRSFELVGICKGLARKKYTISLRVYTYHQGLAVSDVVATGFTSSFLVVDEVFTKDV